jgi:hypothetical protein
MKAPIIKTKYFEAPITDCHPYYPGYESDYSATCSYCGSKTPYIYGSEEFDDSDQEKQGCVTCLIAKKFSISKDTDIGKIDSIHCTTLSGPKESCARTPHAGICDGQPGNWLPYLA